MIVYFSLYQNDTLSLFFSTLSSRFVFWTDWSNTTPYIGRSELDGSNPLRIVNNADDSSPTKLIKWPNGITVDVVKDLIYWVSLPVCI